MPVWTKEKIKRNPTSTGRVNVLTCNTWSEYYNQVRQATPPANKAYIEQTIKLSVTPDPHFAKRIEKHRRTIRLGVSKYLTLAHWKYDVVGSKFDVGRLITGEPHAALKRVQHNVDRTVRILFCSESHVNTHNEAVIIRAAAVAELMIALEEQGIKCELIMGFSTTVSGRKDYYESRIKVKAANTPLNIGSLKYQLDGSEFLYHMEAQLIHKSLNTNSLGHNPGMQCEADVIVSDGGYQSIDKHFGSPEAATAWVADLFTRLREGKLLDKGETN